MAEHYAHEFLTRLKRGLEEVDEGAVENVVEVLWSVYQRCQRVFLMGNGGSAAAASHFCCDLNLATRDRKRMQAVSLNDNTPLLTALANDFGYEEVFTEQLANLVLPGDVVVVISASGESENIVRALRLAKERKATTVGILGFGGGRALAMVDHALVISSEDFFLVESVHAALTHLLAGLLGQRIRGS